MSARVGVQIGATTPASELGAVVAEAERLGYGEAWLAEDYFDLGGVASSAVALAGTHDIPIGLGVVAAPARHPAALAMEYATLSGAFPGRFMAGIGHGAPGWLRQMGLQAQSPMRLLREVTTAVRSLLDGREVTVEGEYFRFEGVRLSHVPSTPVPIYLGVHGPASLRASGELADGTLLGWFSSPSYVTWARERIEEGRARADRTDGHELVALCIVWLDDDDPDGARRRLGAWARPMLHSMLDSPQLKASPMRDELAAWFAESPSGEPSSDLPPHLIDEFAAAGNVESCRNTVRRLLDAGADRVVLVPNPAGLRSTEEMVGQISRAASLVSEA
jgi:alkanesulfonate monooxygenase SsuD/methylene tetrahydromethanopterin reductase-like flavin-dependent oxidoreductase (luciferase family)